MASIQDPVLKVSGAESAVICYQLHIRRSTRAVSRESGALAPTAALTPTLVRSQYLEVISCARRDPPLTKTPPRLLLQDRQHVIAVGEMKSSQPKEGNGP